MPKRTLADLFPSGAANLSTIFPYYIPSRGGGAGFLNPTSIAIATPAFSAVAVIHERGPHVHYADGNYSGPSNSIAKTYTVGDPAFFSYDNVSTGTYDTHSWNLTPSQIQTDSADNITGSWDTSTAGTFTHTLTLNLLSGFDVISSATLVVIVNVNPVPAILFDGVVTSYTTQQPPTPYTSSSQTTTLTFSAVGLPGGDTSVLTMTID